LPLEKAVQTHLFEPFFTSESRSSGLGLYICRELCERYGALIGYQRASRGALQLVEGNEFFVLFKLAAVPHHAALPYPDDLFA
jgi:two-component system sensor histidine kinase PilS (NtrC family)